MEILKVVMWVIQIISAITIIILVLLQHGKGAEAGATLGTSSSSSLFGASGSANFLSRSTAIAAVVFFVSTIFSVILVSSTGNSLGVMKGLNGKVVASAAASSKVVASSAAKASSVIPD